MSKKSAASKPPATGMRHSAFAMSSTVPPTPTPSAFSVSPGMPRLSRAKARWVDEPPANRRSGTGTMRFGAHVPAACSSGGHSWRFQMMPPRAENDDPRRPVRAIERRLEQGLDEVRVRRQEGKGVLDVRGEERARARVQRVVAPVPGHAARDRADAARLVRALVRAEPGVGARIDELVLVAKARAQRGRGAILRLKEGSRSLHEDVREEVVRPVRGHGDGNAAAEQRPVARGEDDPAGRGSRCALPRSPRGRARRGCCTTRRAKGAPRGRCRPTAAGIRRRPRT